VVSGGEREEGEGPLRVGALFHEALELRVRVCQEGASGDLGQRRNIRRGGGDEGEWGGHGGWATGRWCG